MNNVELLNPNTMPEIAIKQSLETHRFDMTAPNQVVVAALHITYSLSRCIGLEKIASIYGNGESIDFYKVDRAGTRAIRHSNINDSGMTIGDIIYKSLYPQGLLAKSYPERQFDTHFTALPEDMAFLQNAAQIGKAYFAKAQESGRTESLYHMLQLSNTGGTEATFAFLQPILRTHILLELLARQGEPMTMHELTNPMQSLNRPMAVSEALVDLHKHGAITIDDKMDVSLTDVGTSVAANYLKPLVEAVAAYCEEKKTNGVTRRTSAEQSSL